MLIAGVVHRCQGLGPFHQEVFAELGLVGHRQDDPERSRWADAIGVLGHLRNPQSKLVGVHSHPMICWMA